MNNLITVEKDEDFFDVFYKGKTYIGTFEYGLDGFLVFWPARQRGSWDSETLKAIADALDFLNEPHKKDIEDYFSEKE